MLRVALALGLVVAAMSSCGSGAGAWLGTWNGSLTANTGRQPVTYSGTLTISASGSQAQLTARGTSGAQEFTCAGLTTATAEDGKLTLAAPATCDLAATPADACTYQAVLNGGELTRTGDTISGSAAGRMTITCTGPGGSITDFALTLAGTRR